MGQLHFYAAGDDLMSVLHDVEVDRPMKYVRITSSPIPMSETFLAAAQLPNLGRATGNQEALGQMFLAMDADAPVTPREIRQSDGVVRYTFVPILNPDTVVLMPGGVWGDDVVISGKLGTASGTRRSESLMRRFRSAMRRRFVKVRAFRVGPRAHALFQSGCRLTQATQSPREYDLREISPDL